MVDPKEGSPVSDILRPIAGAASIISGHSAPSELGAYAPRDDFLIVKLGQPAPFFPQVLTHSATFPVYAESRAKSGDPAHWITNGPYILSNWTPGSKLELMRNPAYRDHSNVRISRVEFIPVSDENAELRQYRAGQLDITEGVPPGALSEIRAERPNELAIAPFLGTAYFVLNLRETTFRTNDAIRKSLAMAIDRRMLMSSLLPFGQLAAYGFVSIGTWNYQPQSWNWKDIPDNKRIAEARRLYLQAGYSADKPLKLRILYNSNDLTKLVTIAMASMWKETLGIETTLINEEYRVFLQSRKDAARWDVIRLGWTADYNDASNFLDTLRHDSPNNDAGYSSREYDSLLDRAASTADSETRRKLLESAEQVMLSDYPIIPIYFYSSRHLIKPYIKGFQFNPLNRIYSKHLTIEPH